MTCKVEQDAMGYDVFGNNPDDVLRVQRELLERVREFDMLAEASRVCATRFGFRASVYFDWKRA